MTEAYLHYIWKNKRLPFPQIENDYPGITLIDLGTHNENLKGPDFSLGKIRFDNVTEIGPIELHVFSSDWYKHNHQYDRNYDNVILHVVFENDLDVLQNGRKIPTIELKKYLEVEHFKKHFGKVDFSLRIPCRQYVRTVDEIIIESMKNQSIIKKLNDKVERFEKDVSNLSDKEMFLKFCVQSFSMGFNQEGFKLLSDKLFLAKIEKLSNTQLLNYILIESDILMDEGSLLWNRKGTRPANHPLNRLGQLSFLLGEIEDFYKCVVNGASIKELNQFFNIFSNKRIRFSAGLKNNIYINGVIPYYWWRGKREDGFEELAIELLDNLPSEKISKLKKWKEVGLNLKSAYDSQALLALIHYYCSGKKCLSCQIGNRILNK